MSKAMEALERLEADARRAHDRGLQGVSAFLGILDDIAAVRAALAAAEGREPVAWMVEVSDRCEPAWARHFVSQTLAGAHQFARQWGTVRYTARIRPLGYLDGEGGTDAEK